MKKRAFIILLVVGLLTGCRATDKQERNLSSEPTGQEQATKSPKNNEETMGTPKPTGASVTSKQEFNVHKSGKEIKYKQDRVIYFANSDIVCYSEEDKKNKQSANQTFFLYERKQKKKYRVGVVKDLNLVWGDMYENDGCLYMAYGNLASGGEKSHIIKIDESSHRLKIMDIKSCNTMYSSVICTKDTVYVWYMKEERNKTEYCLSVLHKGKLKPIRTCVYKGSKNGTGQQMSTFGTNGSELFCYVEDTQKKDFVFIHNQTLGTAKEIPVDFEDFQQTSEEKDAFTNLFCVGGTLLFETLDHRILVADYNGETIQIIPDDELEKALAGTANGEESEFINGAYMVAGISGDQIFICGNLEKTEEMNAWSVANQTIKKVLFKTKKDERVLSYQMLSENEFIVNIAGKDEVTREFYCKLPNG